MATPKEDLKETDYNMKIVALNYYDKHYQRIPYYFKLCQHKSLPKEIYAFFYMYEFHTDHFKDKVHTLHVDPVSMSFLSLQHDYTVATIDPKVELYLKWISDKKIDYNVLQETASKLSRDVEIYKSISMLYDEAVKK